MRKNISPVGIIIAVFLSLAGCATTPPEPVTGVKSIGIVSALGDELQILGVGTTVFQNADDAGNISDWRINELIIANCARLLSSAYEIIDVEYPRSQFNSESKLKIGGGWIEDTSGKISELVKGRITPAKGSAPDAYLVIIPQYTTTALRGYPDLVDVGLYSMSLLGDRKTYVWVGAQMALVDAKSFAVIKRKDFRSNLNPYKPGKRFASGGLSYRRLDNSAWAGSFADLSDEQKMMIRKELEAYLIDAVPLTLHQIGLISEQL